MSNLPESEAQKALQKESELSFTGWQQEVQQGLNYGLEAAESIKDRTISTFSRGELPHYAGINTFLKAPYLEDVKQVGSYDIAIVGVPHDSGTTYRPGTRFGPQGIRKISALYTPYNFELGVDLREQIEVVEVSPPYDVSDMTALMATRVICDTMAHLVVSGQLPRKQKPDYIHEEAQVVDQPWS